MSNSRQMFSQEFELVLVKVIRLEEQGKELRRELLVEPFSISREMLSRGSMVKRSTLEALIEMPRFSLSLKDKDLMKLLDLHELVRPLEVQSSEEISLPAEPISDSKPSQPEPPKADSSSKLGRVRRWISTFGR